MRWRVVILSVAAALLVGMMAAPVLAQEPITVQVDVMPEADENTVCYFTRTHIKVAILTVLDENGEVVFDAPATVDPSTVTLGALYADPPAEPLRWNTDEDPNADGYKDLVLQFVVRDLGLIPANEPDIKAAPVILKGFTFDGYPIEGEDTVHVVPPNDYKPENPGQGGNGGSGGNGGR